MAAAYRQSSFADGTTIMAYNLHNTHAHTHTHAYIRTLTHTRTCCRTTLKMSEMAQSIALHLFRSLFRFSCAAALSDCSLSLLSGHSCWAQQESAWDQQAVLEEGERKEEKQLLWAQHKAPRATCCQKEGPQQQQQQQERQQTTTAAAELQQQTKCWSTLRAASAAASVTAYVSASVAMPPIGNASANREEPLQSAIRS